MTSKADEVHQHEHPHGGTLVCGQIPGHCLQLDACLGDSGGPRQHAGECYWRTKHANVYFIKGRDTLHSWVLGISNPPTWQLLMQSRVGGDVSSCTLEWPERLMGPPMMHPEESILT